MSKREILIRRLCEQSGLSREIVEAEVDAAIAAARASAIAHQQANPGGTMKHRAVFARAFEAFHEPGMDDQDKAEIEQFLVDRYGPKLDAAVEVAISMGVEAADIEEMAGDWLTKVIEREP